MTPTIPDATLLDWIKRRVAGQSSSHIGAVYGVPCAKVRVATNRVRAADEVESGENVDGAYWGQA